LAVASKIGRNEQTDSIDELSLYRERGEALEEQDRSDAITVQADEMMSWCVVGRAWTEPLSKGHQ